MKKNISKRTTSLRIGGVKYTLDASFSSMSDIEDYLMEEYKSRISLFQFYNDIGEQGFMRVKDAKNIILIMAENANDPIVEEDLEQYIEEDFVSVVKFLLMDALARMCIPAERFQEIQEQFKKSEVEEDEDTKKN